MFTEKEITIIKTLVEEEMIYSVTAPNRPDAAILTDYKHTLSTIDLKINDAIGADSIDFSSIS